MKRGFEEILEPEPLFVFMLQYCRNKSEALNSARTIIAKLKARGKLSYSRIFENDSLLKEYAEEL